MAGRELSDDEVAKLGLDQPETPSESTPSPDNAPPIPTGTPVREPGGEVAPVRTAPRELSDDEVAKLGLEEPTPKERAGSVASVLGAREKSPVADQARAAKVVQAAKVTGVFEPLVDADLDRWQREVDAKAGPTPDDLAKQSPKLAQALAESPHLQAAAKDDVPLLQRLEALGGFRDVLTAALPPGLTIPDVSKLKNLRLPTAEETLQDQQADVRFETNPLVVALRGTPFGAMADFFKPTTRRSSSLIINPAQQAVAAGFETSAPTQVTQLEEKALGVEPSHPDPYGASLVKAATGSKTAGLMTDLVARKLAAGVWMGVPLMGEHAFDSMDPAELAEANKLWTDKLGKGAFWMDQALGLIPAMGMPAIGGAEKAGEAAFESAVSKGLGPVSQVVAKKAGETLGAVLEGGAFGASGAVEKPANPESPVGEVVEDTLATAAMAGVLHHGFKTLGGVAEQLRQPGPSLETIAGVPADPQARSQAAAHQAVLAQQFDTVAQLKLKGQAPAAVEQLLEKLDSGATVSFPADKFQGYYQGQRLNPLEEAEKIVPGGGKALSDALAAGGDFTVPRSAALRALAGTGHDVGLAEDMRPTPTQPTPREIAAAQDAVREQLKKAAAERGDDFTNEKSAVQDAMTKAATAAGAKRPQAAAFGKMMAEHYGAQALLNQTSVAEAMRLGGLHELSILGPEAQKAGGEALFQLALSSPEATRQLEERVRQMSEGTRHELVARDAYIDRNTGLPNARAAEETPAPAGKPLTASAEFEGGKYVNETAGHDTGDLLYRAAANALSKAEPTNLARRGGGFTFHVKNEAELRDVLAKANAALPDNLKGFTITGEAGKTFDEAQAAHERFKEVEIAAGRRANPRPPELDADGKPVVDENGKPKLLPPERPRGVPEGPVEFPAERAVSPTPEALVDQLRNMGPRELVQKAYVEPESGVLNSAGREALPRKAHQAVIDIKSFKEFNTEYGPKAGDRALIELGAIARKVGGSGFAFTHLHGDEYALEHDDPAQLAAYLDKLTEVAHNVGVDLKRGDENVTVPLEIRYGLGPTAEGKPLAHAEADLLRRKAAEEPGGGAEPRVAGGATLGRGAQPQGFGGAQEAQRLDALEARGGRSQTVAHFEGEPVGFRQGGKYDAGEPGQIEQEPESEEAKAPAEPRGVIQFGVDETGRANTFRIQLLKNADASTLFHEAGHFLSWSLHNIATSAVASKESVADYATLLKAASYESPDARADAARDFNRIVSMPEADRTEADVAKMKDVATKEEWISHAFEQYIAEGKAPSKPLARVFSKFRDWMLNIYRGTQGIAAQYQHDYGAPLELSDDVRKVFDRMLGQQRAIDAAERSSGGRADDTKAMMRMTPEERNRYMALGRDSKAETQMQTARAESTERQKAIDKDRADFYTQSSEELARLPQYAAAHYLEDGTLPSGASETLLKPEGQPLKLDAARLAETYGDDVPGLMPPGATAGEGLTADELAPLLGYSSGDALVYDLRTMKPREQALQDATQAKLDAKYGTEDARRAQAAMSAVHNAADLERAVMEAKAYAKDVDPTVEQRVNTIRPELIRQEARRLIGEQTVEQLDPAKHARNERGLALKAAELDGRGDLVGAADARQQRIVQKAMFMESRDAKAEMGKAIDRMENPGKKAQERLGLADPSYRDVHNAILAAAQLGESPAEGSKTLDEMLAVAQQQGQPIDFDVAAIRKLLAQPKDITSSMTVEEARGVADAIENIRDAARNQLTTVMDGERVSRQEELESLMGRAKETRPATHDEVFDRTKLSTAAKVAHGLQSAHAFLETIRSLCRSLDGDDINGPFHERFIHERERNRDVAVQLTSDFLEPLLEQHENIPKDILKLKDKNLPDDIKALIPLPRNFNGQTVVDNRTRSHLWEVFKHMGNDGNEQRLLDGYGWDRRNVVKALEYLSPAELDFNQKALDLTDALYGPMADAHERETGIRPPKVEARPLTLNGKEFRGGYYPALADSRQSAQGARAAEISTVNDLVNPLRTGISASFAKQRAAKSVAPLDLSPNMMLAHVAQVIHYVAYDSYVRDTGSLLLDPQFKGTVTSRIGPAGYQALVDNIRTLANANADSLPANMKWWEQASAWSKQMLTLQAVGFSFRSVAGVAMDPLKAMARWEVGPQHLGPALIRAWNPVTFGEMRDAALFASPALRAREQMRENSMPDAMKRISGELPGIREKVQAAAFWGHKIADERTETALFTGKYNSELAKGATHEDAVRAAEDVVSRYTIALDPAEKSAFVNSKAMSAFNMWYGYANQVYNMGAQMGDSAYRAVVGGDPIGTKAMKIAKLAGAYATIGIVEAMGQYIVGQGPGDDESKEGWLARKALLWPAQLPMGLGGWIESVFGGHHADFRNQPIFDYLEKVSKGIKQKYDKAMSGDESEEEKYWDLLSTVGGFAAGVKGIPINAFSNITEHEKKVDEGKIYDRGPLDTASGYLYGDRKDHPANPLRNIQDLME